MAIKKKSIEQLKEIIDDGVEPINVLNDLLEIIYFIQQNKLLGSFDSDLSISEAELENYKFYFKRYKYFYFDNFLAIYS